MTEFQPRSGSTIYLDDDRPIVLDRELGKGGEGSVWSIANAPEIVAKFYYKNVAPAQERKLRAMCRLQSEDLLRIAAWPTAVVRTNVSGGTQGLLMPRVNGYQEAHLLYTPKSRRSKFPEAQFPFILHACINIAKAFATVHDAGQVIGDVNHGNLLISNQATVALIDCDSFEISDGETRYPCPVGVPAYTPPELQGMSFEAVRRTPQHDAFGLAVLLFHMIFLGRHPFAGIFRQGNADKTIEEAIREFRFAYLPDARATEMQPPPSIPALAEFPADLRQLFVRAFSREGASGQRPAALDWIGPLEYLSEHLKRCKENESHHYFEELSACPWCRVENTFGRRMFGFKIAVGANSGFDLSATWAEIDAVLAHEQTPAPVPPTTFIDQCRPHSRIQEIRRQRRMKLLLAGGIVVLATVIVGPGLVPMWAALLIAASAVALVMHLLRLLDAYGAEFKVEKREAERDFQTAMEEWDRLKTIPPEFVLAKQELEAQKKEFEDLASLRKIRLTQLDAGVRHKQLNQFLEAQRIENAAIPNIGPGRKTLLLCYGIEDASDVHPALDIKGFGPALKASLLAWRQSVEAKFVFKPNEGIDPADVRALDQEFSQKISALIQSLSIGPQTLKNLLLPWRAERNNALANLNSCARVLAKAEVNVEALRRW